MSVIGNSQPIVIPDPAADNSGPSAFNVPIVSQSPGAPTSTGSLAGNGASNKFYTIASALFPQTAGTQNTYRFTFNGYLDLPSPPSGGGGGNVNLLIQRRTSGGDANTIGCSTSYYNGTGIPLAAFAFYFSISCIFLPSPGDTLEVTIVNNTQTTFLNPVLRPLQGSGIELVSKQTTQQLIFS
jgi:hypothetical protein